MKKNLIVFFTAMFLPVMAWAGQDFGTVFDAAIYQSPDTNSHRITTIEVGSKLHITAFDHDNFWARVVLPDGQTGYVDTGSLDYPGGQTVTVTETFDSNNIASKGAGQSNVLKIITSIIFFLLMAAGLGHMLYIRENQDNEPRIFVGSGARLVFFSVLMAFSVFMADGFWPTLFVLLGALLSLAFSYYAYLRPQSKLLIGGAPTKNPLQVLGGMWTDMENIKTDKARIDVLKGRINILTQEKSASTSQGERDRLAYEISSMESDIHNEQNKVLNETVGLTFMSVAIGVVFIWITPFVAILQYVRNYPLYLRKRDAYQQEAAKIGYVD